MKGTLTKSDWSKEKEEIIEIEAEYYEPLEQAKYLIINLLEFLENDKIQTFKIEKL
jgi:hypothetical protein